MVVILVLQDVTTAIDLAESPSVPSALMQLHIQPLEARHVKSARTAVQVAILSITQSVVLFVKQGIPETLMD